MSRGLDFQAEGRSICFFKTDPAAGAFVYLLDLQGT